MDAAGGGDEQVGAAGQDSFAQDVVGTGAGKLYPAKVGGLVEQGDRGPEGEQDVGAGDKGFKRFAFELGGLAVVGVCAARGGDVGCEGADARVDGSYGADEVVVQGEIDEHGKSGELVGRG